MSTTGELSGRWTPEDRAESVYHPVDFEVPAGTSSVCVELDYDRAGGIVDLGCWGVDGFRGWSGGARSRYVITPDRATPGYLPGRPPAGAWQVLLGLHRINPEGLPWRLTVTTDSKAIEDDPALSDDGEPIDALLDPARTRPQRLGSTRRFPAPKGWQWLAGDLHAHTVHSDGSLSVEDLARLATSRGLDFLAVTDHNTISHHPHLAVAARTAGIVLVPGQEVTTDRGHANAFGDIGWVDFRHPAERWLETVMARNGLLSINHPLGFDCAWRQPLTKRPPLAEVWHSSWFDRRDGGPLAWWQAGSGVSAATPVGGSDWHRPGSDAEPGQPTTWLLCQEPSSAGVLEALGAGRTSLSADPTGPVLLRLDDELMALDAEGLLLSGPGRGRQLIRGMRATLAADDRPYWLEDHQTRIMALTA